MADSRSYLVHALAEQARPLTGSPADFDSTLDRIGRAHYVLIGEASHGTHEFYRLRAELTKRLIREYGFHGVAVEGDWPDCYRVNRYVHGRGSDGSASEALSDFTRFPAWMWRNAEVLDFVGWLRAHNEHAGWKAGFYGLDLYSLHASMSAVLEYLDQHDPEAARRARMRYGCIESYGDEPEQYAQAAFAMDANCSQEVHQQLLELQQKRGELLAGDGVLAEDEHFQAEQNARVVLGAEEYYRSMFSTRVNGWNLRDMHMADTLEALSGHLAQRVGRAKLVVWAHNSHVGDARATQMGWMGELNIGQVVRQRHPEDTVLIGFSTHTGTVTAADDWGSPALRKQVRPSLEESYEHLFHLTGIPRFLLPLGELGEAASALREPRLERAIGVVYRPQTERASHYFKTRIVEQFDYLIHIDETRALEPLDRTSRWDAGEAPETYPFGL